jgi:hypothetical protein
MIIVPDKSSDDDDDDDDKCLRLSCTPLINDEHDLNNHRLWDDLSHIVKCIYRATDKEFSGLLEKQNFKFNRSFFS